jgi:threonine dehydrogenase-like Zn-dependent dehydrogenase
LRDESNTQRANPPSATVQAGLSLLRIGGTLVLAGTVLPTAAVALDPETVVRRWLTLRGVHNYTPVDLQTAVDFLEKQGENYPFAGLVGPSYPLAEVEQAFSHAHAHPGTRVAVHP